MRKIATGIVLFVCAVAAALGQSGQTTITASHIAYFGGVMVSGNFCLTPTDQTGQPINIVTLTGQQIYPQVPLCFPIVAGTLSNTAIVPDTSTTQPVNSCYRLIISNTYGQQVAVYNCIQPSSSTWSFDSYIPSSTPTIPALALPQFQLNGSPLSNQMVLNFICPGCSLSSGGFTIPTSGSLPSIAANTILGNNTGSTAAAAALTASQVSTLLGLGTAAVVAAPANTTRTAHQFFTAYTASSGAYTQAAIAADDTSGGAYVAAAGSVNVLTATLSPAPASLAVGLEVNILPDLANTTTTPTLNVNSLGAATITKNGAAALAAGDLTTTAIAKLLYDGTHWQLLNPQTSSAGLPSIAAHTYLGNNTGSTATATASAIGAQDTGPSGYATTTGLVNVMAATLTPAVTSYTAGLEVSILPNLANTTTTPTLNLNSLGAKTITKNGAAALAAGDLTTTAIAWLVYDGTEFQLLNPQTTTATNLAGSSVDSAPYQSAAGVTSYIASPTTSGHTFFYSWQPAGSAIAPAALDFTTFMASPPAFGGTTPNTGAFTTLSATTLSVGSSPPAACGSATGCWASKEASTAGTPAAGQDYIRADSTSHSFVYSINGGAEASLPGTIVAVPTPLTAQAANLTSTTIYTTPAADHYYQVCAEANLTRPATTSSTMVQIQIDYTSSVDNVVKVANIGTTPGQTGNGTFEDNSGCVVLHVKASTTIQWATVSYVSTGATTMQYSLSGTVQLIQ